MSAFHRVEDIRTMRADLLVRRARCLMAYEGAVRQEVRRQQAETIQAPQDTGQAVSGAPADDEDALWADYRQRAYAKYLKPGERPREIGTTEGLALAAQVMGVR